MSSWRSRLHDLAKSARFVAGYVKAPIMLWFATGSYAHRSLFIGRSPRIENRGHIRVGEALRMRCMVARTSLSVATTGVLEIGDYVFINQGSHMHAQQRVSIGNRVDIGDGVRIYDTNFHATRPGEATKVAEVIVEDDVWISSGAVILPGVRIGRGSVIGAGAIVASSVPAGSIVTGPKATTVATFEVPLEFDRRSEAGYLPR